MCCFSQEVDSPRNIPGKSELEQEEITHMDGKVKWIEINLFEWADLHKSYKLISAVILRQNIFKEIKSCSIVVVCHKSQSCSSMQIAH